MSDITDRLRRNVRLTPAERTDLRLDALEEIEGLRARVAQLEACLTDTVQQLELGGVKE